MEDLENNIIIQENYICKSISGEEDENGNYKFEVEASNENLDLQNQITLQSALKKSEEYFVTNGVISDDHLHKTRNPDGSVETHKDKIIGEPISVRFDPSSKKTFVKGILYSGIEAAKPYIELLKNKSRLVKASIGGIMPKVRKNADGSETITSFMWNDLALTCSPVNWTVGSAKFAKSIGADDFCKSLNAGTGTDAATMTDGRALQEEDLEDETVKLQKITDGELKGKDEEDDVEKSAIRECKICMETGELNTEKSVINFLVEKGLTKSRATETALGIINMGGIKMKKGSFSSTINDLLKSFGNDDDEDKKKKVEDDAENTLFDDEDDAPETDDMPDEDDDGEDDVSKGCMKKSLEDEGDYLDATELMKSMAETIDLQKSEIESLKKSLEEVQDNMIEVTKSFGDYLKTPNARTTVMEKSFGTGNMENVSGPAKRPTTADFDVLKSALVDATKKGTISLDEVQFYNAEFQKSMKGQKIDPKVWSKICTIVRENR